MYAEVRAAKLLTPPEPLIWVRSEVPWRGALPPRTMP